VSVNAKLQVINVVVLLYIAAMLTIGVVAYLT
jgi:hypothetical protein